MNILDFAAMQMELCAAGVRNTHPTGSRQIPGAWTEDSDFDFACLSFDLDKTRVDLLMAGWTDCAPAQDTGKAQYTLHEDTVHERWIARKGDVNLIVFKHTVGFAANVYAQAVCEQDEIIDRDQRIDVFEKARELVG